MYTCIHIEKVLKELGKIEFKMKFGVLISQMRYREGIPSS